jgi:hypothetical protein
LDLPDLKASDACNYTKVLEFHNGSSGWQTKEEETANLKCAGVLKAAKIATVNDLPGENSAVKFAKELHAPPSCNITNVTDDGRFALYDCSEGHQAWDMVITTSRSLLVLSTASGASVLSVTLKPKQPTIATLVTVESHQYLVVVRDGIMVEAYPVAGELLFLQTKHCYIPSQRVRIALVVADLKCIRPGIASSEVTNFRPSRDILNICGRVFQPDVQPEMWPTYGYYQVLGSPQQPCKLLRVLDIPTLSRHPWVFEGVGRHSRAFERTGRHNNRACHQSHAGA